MAALSRPALTAVLFALGALAPSLGAADSAKQVTLRAPLATMVALPGGAPAGPQVLCATVTVPPDAPADLGVGAWLRDRQGRWWQRLGDGPLEPGSHEVRLAFGADDPASGPGAGWSPVQAAIVDGGGLFFWSAGGSRAVLTVAGLRSEPAPAAVAAGHRLDALAPDAPRVATGERWSLSLRPDPFPADPYEPAQFDLTLVIRRPDGVEERVSGFYEQPMRGVDRGDREEVLPDGRARFAVRYRPRVPGAHHLHLEARWGRAADAAPQVSFDLPDLQADGAAVDPYARVDAKDPRFFSVDGRFWWPNGPNLRSVSDPRAVERMGSKPTPLRGTLAYDAYFARLAASGVDAVEVWLSSWNLAMEWRAEWPGYHGLGRYNEDHAWQLDRILDSAWANGIRVNLAVNNHGQAAGSVDSEWRNSPFNRDNGGPLRQPGEMLTSPAARARQEQVRRYLVARYADHPAIMAWKLWTEMDFLGDHQRRNRMEPLLAAWHEDAAKRWRALDLYAHPVTSHWSSNWTRVHPTVAALPGLEFLCFNAYHEPEGRGGEAWVLARLLTLSAAADGLGRYGKPLLITEYGGQWSGCPEPQMIAEHASGGWCALVLGMGGAPMLWWYEWIDQGDRFAPFAAVHSFLAGEDLREPRARSLALASEEPEVWARGWSRPGRLLGYLLDLRWQADGGERGAHPATTLTIAGAVPAGPMTVTWWDADRGVPLSSSDFAHAGGPLTLRPPEWRRHLAFKLVRR